MVVSSIAGSTELLVTWQPGSGAPREHVVDWARDGEPPENLNWVRLPPGNLSALLPGEALLHLVSHPSCGGADGWVGMQERVLCFSIISSWTTHYVIAADVYCHKH